jgi:outer membrane protein assembly factor BamD (BamD/ComL family)
VAAATASAAAPGNAPTAAAPSAAPQSTARSAAPPIDANSLATPEAALQAAKSELAAGRVPNALAALDRLLALAPEGTDEAYILYARALEQNGPEKDIKRAYAYYKKLRDEYPESAFWDEAASRASYIERRYFDIR